MPSSLVNKILVIRIDSLKAARRACGLFKQATTHTQGPRIYLRFTLLGKPF
jgi:hypothetical protein